jgi:hypothetical protein
MLNAADALAQFGYKVRVVSTRYLDWAWQTDQDVRKSRNWDWTVVGYGRYCEPWKYVRTGVRLKVARFAARKFKLERCPLWLAERAYSRVHMELIEAILSEPSDLVYAGTNGALAAAALSGTRMGIPYALDLEDFHSIENGDDPEGQFSNALMARIEHAILSGAAFLTAGSSAIAEAYKFKYGVVPIARHNVFSLPRITPDLTASCDDGLRLYWFGQTIGPGRGLENAVMAMGKAHIPGEMHLRGRAATNYLSKLEVLAGKVAPELRIVHHPPAPPDSMVDLCRGYDVGLAIDEDRELSLTNKALTYVLAGLALAISDTSGQRAFARELQGAAILIRPGDTDGLAAGLKRWSETKSLLARAKSAAWEAAKSRWHWEHPEERGALLKAVAQVFQS